MDLYIDKDGKKLRCGYTTGSCATAASKASAIMLETGEAIDYVEIDTPAAIRLRLRIYDIDIQKDYVSCAVVKDGGDDPDSTDGMKIYSKVMKNKTGEINIEGGLGIGRITKRGLMGEVGAAAINPVPRQMIQKELREFSNSGYDVLIYAPEGEAIGKKTFNSNIGIQGGISIIGTKGIVYPMSEEALIKTIHLEIDMVGENYGKDQILLVPGNYGEKVAKELGLDIPMVQVSNFIGDGLSYVYSKGFKKISLLGHIGKFSKLAIGIFNTHNRVSDARMEAFVYYLARLGGPSSLMEEIDQSLTAEEALEICIREGYASIVEEMERGAETRIKKYLKDEEVEVSVKIYSMKRGVSFD